MVRCQLHKGRNLKVLPTEVSVQHPEQCLAPTGNRHSVFVKRPVLKKTVTRKRARTVGTCLPELPPLTTRNCANATDGLEGVLKMTLKQFMPQRQVLACKSPRQSQGLLGDMAGNTKEQV